MCYENKKHETMTVFLCINSMPSQAPNMKRFTKTNNINTGILLPLTYYTISNFLPSYTALKIQNKNE